MPHLTLEYSDNIAAALDAPALLRTLHETIKGSGIDAYKIKSRAVKLTDYIIGDEQSRTSMVHATCLLLAGRPAPFAENLSKSLLAVIDAHLSDKNLTSCGGSVEVRNMEPELYSKQEGT